MAKKSLEQKIQEEMPEFFEEVQACSDEQLEHRLAQSTKDLVAVEDAQEADEALEAAQAQAAELAAPYRDAKKAIKLRSRYLIKVIRDRGGK